MLTSPALRELESKFVLSDLADDATLIPLHTLDKVAPTTPLLHVYSEQLTASRASCEDAMRRLFAFLGVPPLPAVCDRAGAPAPERRSGECRGGDGLCSVEKLRAPRRAWLYHRRVADELTLGLSEAEASIEPRTRSSG
ncbi:hypothetical protein EMIHUDRAFT_224881 [Emiliania huxleyi CCMP1516]|uniref:Sulfotransferase domain-containing protein n=2 Tax=Emiliania huxleyi TaxID=2903 RepID=A0A0D3KQ71_EMIH1|nr:hypothetical protein EMIHUDRAFT_224881 [Emiliania huxleyi CCMP1516]EOD37906.1 hypothetical protein EMIHUDRAFT_224881 [Emiliania huxleyi CCMP1516]|eukprot:XP_005790335.1 hypothetical protein EMIHUDRAFT_224881 [Emiliania huxleyi CCMP1516]